MKEINKEKFLELYNQGKKDTKIALELGVGRKLVGKFRKSLGLKNYKESSLIRDSEFVNKVKEFAGKLSDRNIAKLLNVDIYYITAIRNLYNLPTFDCKVINKDKEKQILDLYKQDKTDSEISKITGVQRAAIQYYRYKHNMPAKFTYKQFSKIGKNKFEELFYKGLSDYAIAKELNVSPDGVYSYRMRHKYYREENLRFNKAIALTDFQKQVLIGTLLGDSSLQMGKKCVSPSIVCAHGTKQKEYCEHKTKVFENLGAKCNYHRRNKIDERTGIYYEDYTMFIPANPEFLPYYNSFYPNGKKVIPLDLLNQFTEVSLAFMYMDDGSRTKSGYNIATNCFNTTELNKFRYFLLEKFNLETSLHTDNVLYIRHKSKVIFESLVSPYIIESMKYKIHSLLIL